MVGQPSMKVWTAVILQLVGLVALVAGCALISRPLGFIVAGFAALLLGAMMEHDSREDS